jgi:hypothetical protein
MAARPGLNLQDERLKLSASDQHLEAKTKRFRVHASQDANPHAYFGHASARTLPGFLPHRLHNRIGNAQLVHERSSQRSASRYQLSVARHPA